MADDVLNALDIVRHINVDQIGTGCAWVIALEGGLGDTCRTANIRERRKADLDDHCRGCVASAVLRPATCHIELKKPVAEWNQPVVDAAIEALGRQTSWVSTFLYRVTGSHFVWKSRLSRTLLHSVA